MPDEQTLAQRVRAKFPGQYDDLSDAELETRVIAKHPEYGDLPRTKPAEGGAKLMASHESKAPAASEENPALGEFGHRPELSDIATIAIPVYGPMKAAGLATKEALPAVGGLIGGIATGGAGLIPAALAAGAGGGIGSIAKNAMEYFQGARKSPGDVATDVATDAAVQGGSQLVGGALSKGVGKVGEALYRRALGPSKALAAEFPDVVETGLEQGANVTKAGLAKAEAARAASAATAKDAVLSSPAAKAGVRVSTNSVAKGLEPLRTAAASMPEANIAQDQIDTFAQNLQASHPRGFSLEELLKTKGAAQDAARAAYKASEKAGTAGMGAEANEAVARQARQILEGFAPASGPANAQTQRLIGLTRALEDANTRNYINRAILGGTAGVVEGVRSHDPVRGVATGLGTAAVTDPRIMGAAGIGLNKMAGQGQIPANVLRAALLQLMGQEQQQP